jgi:hypothetical protein
MARLTRLTLLFVLLLGLAGRLEAASLKVSPARFIVHNVEPGKLYDLYKETRLRLTVYNDDTVSRTWVLSTHRPSERGRWEKGYAEIPDARWCWFDKDEITVEPNSKAYANLHLKIPDEERYYNQHWVVTLSIGSKPGRGGIGVAVDIRAQIETKSSADVKTRPYGLLGLKPSIVRFEDTKPGGRKKAQVEIFNNDVGAQSYTISSLLANAETDQKKYLTHSYKAIPDFKWVKHERIVQIEPGKSATLSLDLEIPDDEANFDKKWEDILLVQPDDGRAGFVRVQVQTTEKMKVE